MVVEHVAVANTDNPGARFAAPSLVLVEEKLDAPLNNIGLVIGMLSVARLSGALVSSRE